MKIQTTNLEIDAWFDQLPEKIDLWVTDPPYPFDSQNGTNRYDGMYERFTWERLFDIYQKIYDHTNTGGRCYMFCNRDGLFNTMSGLKDAGFNFLNILVWDKQHFGGGYHWRNQAEYLVYVSKGKVPLFVQKKSNIFNYKKPKKSDAIPEINYFPKGTSSKPYQIWSDILTYGSMPADVCADPFAGSDPMTASLNLNSNLLNKIKKAYTNIYITEEK